MGCDPVGGMCGGGSQGNNPQTGGAPSGAPPTQAAFGPGAGSGTGANSYAPANASQPNPNGAMNPVISQLCGSTNQVVPYTQNYTDPLGPNQSGNMAPSGGPEMRAGIYSSLQSLFPELGANTQQSTNALKTAAAAPGYGDAADLATKEINGGYLNGSPQLDNAVTAMRQGSERQTADNANQIRSKFAQNGMSFGTGQQEAEQANAAAQDANANQTEANMRLQNYQTERGNQDTAVSRLDNATGSPINYLSQVNASQLSPLSSMSQMITGLSGGGSTSYQPQDVVNNQGYLRQLTSSVGSL